MESAGSGSRQYYTNGGIFMTVLHAEYAGKSPTLPGFSNRDSVLLMELVEKGKAESKIQTPLSEFKRALSENRGVALFELHIKDDPKVRNVIVQQVRRNPSGEGIQTLTLRESPTQSPFVFTFRSFQAVRPRPAERVRPSWRSPCRTFESAPESAAFPTRSPSTSPSSVLASAS